MKILIDINHPAHVHFFRNPARLLIDRGHEVLFTSRDKEIVLELLDELGIRHKPLSALGKRGLFSLGIELIQRDFALYRVVRNFKPDIMSAIGGTFIAHVGALTHVPSLVFYDTENARLQNLITYPLASCVFVPRCYESWVPEKRCIRYAGYHELSYLHPNYFIPNKNVAIANGLSPDKDTFFVRLLSWQASHDVGEQGWTLDLLRKVVAKLETYGKVLISSEAPLAEEFAYYRYQGKVSEAHHVMAYCRAFVGESATMVSECAVIGVPAIYVAQTGRGYTNEQEQRYGLVRNVRQLKWSLLEMAIDDILAKPKAHWQEVRQSLLNDTIDVADFVASTIETFPAPLHENQKQQ
jgi:predicted glycosyltransferase